MPDSRGISIECQELIQAKSRLLGEIYDNRINLQNAINQYPFSMFSPDAKKQIDAKVADLRKMLDEDFKQIVTLDEKIYKECERVDVIGGYFNCTPPFYSIIFCKKQWSGGAFQDVKGFIYDENRRLSGEIFGNFETAFRMVGTWKIGSQNGKINITFTSPRYLKGTYGYGDKEFTYPINGYRNWEYSLFGQHSPTELCIY